MAVTSTPAQASTVVAIEPTWRVMSTPPVKPTASRQNVSGDSSARLAITWSIMRPSAAIHPLSAR